jgi:hypothetical protein
MIDRSVPVTEEVVTGSPQAGYEVTLSTGETGGASVSTQYSYDGISWNTYTEPLSISAEGVYTIYYRSADSAGNVEPARSVVITVDKTPPMITGWVTALPNANGWFNSDVTVHFEASDVVSGLASVTQDITLTAEGNDQGVIGTAVDNAGNSASFTVKGINIDRTAPTIDGAPDWSANNNGWYNADVKVTFTGYDGLSGVDIMSAPVTIGEGANQVVIGRITDKAGNSASYTIGGINVDKTPPSITGSSTPIANNYGWNREDVTVQFDASDGLSGLALVTPDTVFTEGADQSVTGTACDLAGNIAMATVSGVNVDKTAPIISGAATTSPNANGWYNSDVTVHFEASDDTSGLDTVTPNTVISSEGAGLATMGTATDRAGNSASCTIGGINLDKTKPIITGISLTMDPVLVNTGISVTAAYTEPNADRAILNWGDGSSSSTISLIAVSDSTIRGSHIYVTSGVYIVTITIVDLASNEASLSATNYAVVYDPNGGFVTGGGWINSLAGAYNADPTLAGKATFGFVAKYQKGSNVPTGNTEFQFKAGDLNFKSTAYDWLVVAGAKAQYKGTGTINGAGSYRFILTAIDGDQLSRGKPDMFRIRIWNENTGGIIYDNQMGAADSAEPTTVLGGGSVVIHK